MENGTEGGSCEEYRMTLTRTLGFESGLNNSRGWREARLVEPTGVLLEERVDDPVDQLSVTLSRHRVPTNISGGVTMQLTDAFLYWLA
jgi:hypothetical protein